MDLVKVDHIDREATETVFDFTPNRINAQRFSYVALRVPAQAALGEDVGPRTRPFFERASYDFLGVSQTIDGGSVDPVDAKFERAVNGCDGIVVVLRSPCELPTRATDGPGAVSHGSDVHVGVAELALFHSYLHLELR